MHNHHQCTDAIIKCQCEKCLPKLSICTIICTSPSPLPQTWLLGGQEQLRKIHAIHPSIHPSIHPCQLCQISEASMKNLTWLDFKLTMVVWSKSQMRQSKVRRRGGEATHPPTNSIFLLPLFAGVHKIIPWSKKIVEGGPKKGPLGSKKLSKSVKLFWDEEGRRPTHHHQ